MAVEVLAAPVVDSRGSGVGVTGRDLDVPERDAGIEDAMDQLLASADQAAALDDPWAAFEALIVGACELQARNRAVADILGSSYPVTGPLHAACAHLEGRFVDVMVRGRRAGVLRPDLTVTDMGPIMWSVARIAERSGPDQADAWRRHLRIILDGLRWPATAGPP